MVAGRILAIFLLFVGVALPSQAQDEPRSIVIGTAAVSGTYYPVGGALCRMINQRQAADGLRCLVEPTGGSAENLERLKSGALDLAIVQSDWQYHAASGTASDGQPPFTELRSLLVLQPQIMTLVARSDSGILEAADLAGKRVGIGPAGSAVNAGARRLLEALEIEVTRIELPVARDVAAFCNGEIDAFLLPVAHPNGAIGEALEVCGGLLLDLQGAALDRLLATWPYYVRATIPADLYGIQGNEVQSYGVAATLVTTAALPDEAAYQITRAVFDNLEAFKAQYPALASLIVETMTGAGLSAPLHPGALRYYQEQGWR